VVNHPDAPDGSKQGADDYLAAGGTVGDMERPAPMTQPSADEIIRRDPSCLCEWCAGEPITSYLRIGALA